MILFGITGAIGHGKSTLAESLHIAEPGMLHLETNQPIIDLANALIEKLDEPILPTDADKIADWLKILPVIVERTLGRLTDTNDLRLDANDIREYPADYEKLLHFLQLMSEDFATLRQPITVHNKEFYRPILQWLGGYLVSRLDKAVWIAEVIERAREYGDGGGVLAVIGGIRFPFEAETINAASGHIIRIERPGFSEIDIKDATERYRSEIVPDIVVQNTGSVLDLLPVAEHILSDAVAGHLQTLYISGGNPTPDEPYGDHPRN